MNAITARATAAFNDYNIAGVPNSGAKEPIKAEIRSLFATIDAALEGIGAAGGATVFKTTRALLNADLAHPAGRVALVYADPTADNNDFYLKSGTSGSGSWTKLGITMPAALSAQIAEFIAAYGSIESALEAGLAARDEAIAARDVAVGAQNAVLTARDEAEAARDDAIAAAQAAGVARFYVSKAAADAALSDIPDGGVATVFMDETRGNYRTWYRKVGGALAFLYSEESDQKVNSKGGRFSKIGGEEGGEFVIERPDTNSSLVGDVVVDVKGNLLRAREGSGTERGFNIDLTELEADAGSRLATTAYVDDPDVRKFGMTCDGVSSDVAGLLAAFASQEYVTIRRGTLYITSNILLPKGKTLILEGDAKLKIATGVTFSFYGSFQVVNYGRKAVIEEVGTGKFIGPSKVGIMWWHLGGATDSIHTAWNKAVRCTIGAEVVTPDTLSDLGQIELYLPPGEYRTTQPLKVKPNKYYAPFFRFGEGVLDGVYIYAATTFDAGAEYDSFTIDGVAVRPVIHVEGTPMGEAFEICKFGFGPGLVVSTLSGGGDSTWAMLIGSPGNGVNSLGETTPKFINAETHNIVFLHSLNLNHVCQVNAARVFHEGAFNTSSGRLKAKGYTFTCTTGAYCGDSYIGRVNGRLPVPGDSGYADSAFLYVYAGAGNFDNTTGAGKNFVTYIKMIDCISHGGYVGGDLVAENGSNVDEIQGEFTHDQGNGFYLRCRAYKRDGFVAAQINNVNMGSTFMTGMTMEAVYLACLDNVGLTRSLADIAQVGRIDKVTLGPTKVIRPQGPLAFFSNGVRNFLWDGCTVENAQYISGPMVNIEGGSGIKFKNFAIDLDGYTDPFALAFFLVSRDADFVTIEADFKDQPVTYYIRDLNKQASDGTGLVPGSTPPWQFRNNRYDIKRASAVPYPEYDVATSIDVNFLDRNQTIIVKGNGTLTNLPLNTGEWLKVLFTGTGTVIDGNAEGADPTSGILLKGGDQAYKKFTTMDVIGYNGVAISETFNVN